MGQDCGYIMCPGNCSSETAQGVCDKGYGRCLCAPGYGAEDCSVHLKPNQLVFNQLFNSGHLADSLDHLRNQLPRLGHSLVADRRGSLWMFGGLSLTHGPLNDIRLFDTKNNTWMQVTVDSTREANEPNMPQGRYFHAAEIAHSRGEIYVYGGLTEKEEVIGLSNNTLSDFWKFNLKNQRWIDIQVSGSTLHSVLWSQYSSKKDPPSGCNHIVLSSQDSNKKAPPPLAGHTLTLRLSAESESLVLIGGFSPRYGFLETVWEFDLNTDTWHIITTKGNGPLGVYGHSTVYHAPSRSFYVFGGYMYSVNHTFISDKLYALHYPSQFWSVLPSFQEYNPVKHHLPRARFLHSAVTTDEYMLVFGGRSFPRNTTDSLIAYIYSCNQWVRLISRGA
uniref:EGF-like domain-containing protein n=1 Tax=Timema shepardi TaxID=629360 RepID=A0A7R9B5U8_TIMSH|nr:unnamed protein product [Timema shepardi]